MIDLKEYILENLAKGSFMGHKFIKANFLKDNSRLEIYVTELDSNYNVLKDIISNKLQIEL